MKDAFLDDLFRAAKACPPDTSRAEYALETRVLARIRAAADRANDDWLAWAGKLLPAAGAVAAACVLWVAWDRAPEAETSVPEALAGIVWEVAP